MKKSPRALKSLFESQYREVSVAIPTKGMSSPLKVLIEVTFARCLWPVVMVSKRVKPCRFDDLLLLGATRDRLILQLLGTRVRRENRPNGWADGRLSTPCPRRYARPLPFEVRVHMCPPRPLEPIPGSSMCEWAVPPPTPCSAASMSSAPSHTRHQAHRVESPPRPATRAPYERAGGLPAWHGVTVDRGAAAPAALGVGRWVGG